MSISDETAPDKGPTLLLDRFALGRAVGHGGIARVFLAKDLLLGREIAIKLIHGHLAGDRRICERFMRELAVARTILHPRILELYEFYEDGERRFITMEYLPGGDLKSRILAHGALNLPEAGAIALDALDALGFAHGKGVVHRDVKPQNLLFDAGARVKVSDFGLARIGSGEGFASATVSAGTPEYCPPELVQGQLTDARGDLYSFGVVLFEMLTGILPFRGNSPYEVLRQHVESPVPDPSLVRKDLGPGLPAVLGRALAKDPADRFQTAGDFSLALREALGGGRSFAVPSLAGALRGTELPAAKGAGPAAATATCPSCGKPLAALLPYCFACGCRAISLEPAPKGARKASVVVMGPGRAGNKLEDSHRQALLALLAGEESDKKKLRKSIPRLPFTLASGLEPSSAAQLAAELRSRGLETRVGGQAEEDAAIRSGYLKKLVALVPRLWLIGFGGSSGFWSSIPRMVGKTPGSIVSLLVFALFVAVPIGAAIAYTRPVVKPRKTGGGGRLAARLRAELLRLPGELVTPALQGMAHDVARKLEVLVADEEALGLGDEEIEGLAGDLGQWVELCLCAQVLERHLTSRPEALIMRELRELESGAQDGGAQDGGAQGRSAADSRGAKARALADELARRRETERTLDRAFDRLLSFSARLDALGLGLAASRTGEVRGALDLLSATLADSDLLVEASRQTGLLPKETGDV